jgi:hypothetical protein
MLNTFIDLEIINEFGRARGIDILEGGNVNDYNNWNSFLEYLRTKTNLFIHANETDPLSGQLLKLFSTNRGESTVQMLEKFQKPHKSIFKPQSPHTVFYLDENNDEVKNTYRRKNGFHFGFNNDYQKKFQCLVLNNLPEDCSVRRTAEKPFNKWTELQKYLLPFTDVVFVDNYIMSDESLIPSNLEAIMIELDKASPVKYNFTLVTYEGNREKLYTRKCYQILENIKMKHKLKANISLVVTTRSEMEHDRTIIMNYLRIYSGDSFNYFSSKDEIITRGTEIHFQSLSSPDKFNAAKAALSDISNSISGMKKKFGDKYIKGNLKNSLLHLD